MSLFEVVKQGSFRAAQALYNFYVWLEKKRANKKMKFKTYESVKPQHTNGVCVDFEHECNVEVRFFYSLSILLMEED